MNTTDNFAINNHDALRKVLRKFTVTDEGADGIGATSTIVTEFSYNANDWYSVNVCEIRDEEDCHGIFDIALYYTHPEYGTYTIAENDCRYYSMSERTEILARELIECVGIIETRC